MDQQAYMDLNKHVSVLEWCNLSQLTVNIFSNTGRYFKIVSSWIGKESGVCEEETQNAP